jgi:hypothetical protein
LGSDRPKSMTVIRTDSSLIQAHAVASGAGIAVLPSYTRAITSALVPLPVLPQMRVTLNYYFHARSQHSRSLRQAIEWLKDAFDPESYPWFNDRFVHPDDFPKTRVQHANVVSPFKHLVDRVITQGA